MKTDAGHPRGRRPRRRARRRLRHGRHPGPGRGRQRVLLGGRRRSGWPSCSPASAAARALVGVCGAPFKCPPAPSEAALLLHDHLTERGVRDECEITFVMPLPSPVPPSPETSAALLEAFAERDIAFLPGQRVASLDPRAQRRRPRRRRPRCPTTSSSASPSTGPPDVVIASGMTEDGYVPVDSRTLETGFPGVYAVGDVATVGVPKAGRLRRGRGAGRRRGADRADPQRRGRRRLRGPGLLLHRVRRRPGRPGRRRLPLRPEADRHLPRALGRAASPRRSASAPAAAPAGSASRRRLPGLLRLGAGGSAARRSAARSPASGPARSRARRRRRRRSPRSGGSR